MGVSGSTGNNENDKKYDCTDCPYPRYKDSRVIFCDVCIRKNFRLAEGEQEKKGESRWRMKING